MSRPWFIADPHFGHAKMAHMRGFESTGDMDRELVAVWRALVDPGDRVYVLGDFFFRGDLVLLLDQLPGQLFLVAGNHDGSLVRKHPRWIWVREAAWLKFYGQRVHMSHYAFETWRNSHYGSWHLHGHSHGSLAPRGKRMDVGVDSTYKRWGYYGPIGFGSVSEYMAGCEFEQVDHHGPERSSRGAQ